MKLHADEIEIDESLVSRLLADQFPAWSNLPIKRVRSDGTDNVMFKLGEEMSIRLPRIPKAAGNIEKEQTWLPKLAPHLPFPIPIPVGKGVPSKDYPYHWSVCTWLDGIDALAADITDFRQVASDLARFLRAMQQLDTAHAPLAEGQVVRGTALSNRDADTRKAISEVADMFDTPELTAAWQASLAAPDWDKSPVWLHGDMLPGNVLIKENGVSAIIDFSSVCVGDPACDLMIAWNLLPAEARDVLRIESGVDEATWNRGRGHALSQALIFIPYYLHSHPKGVARAKKAIENVLADF